MAQNIIRNRKTWIIYILLALYAYFLNILGPITPYLHDEFQLSYTVSSLHFSAFAVGILVVGLGGHLVIQRFGRLQSLSIGAFGLGLGALLLIMGRSPVITVGATFLMGCVGSLILAVVPPALSEEHGELRAVAISEANVLASVVSSAAPLLVGWLASLLIGWRVALILGAVTALLVGAILFKSGQSRPFPESSDQPTRKLPLLFWLYWVILVLAVSVEFCMVFWSADYMEKVLGMMRASAAQTVSLFLGGMIAGRFISSRVLRFWSTRTITLASMMLGMAGFAIYWSTSSAAVGMAGLAITGLGVAGLYPLIQSIAIGASGGNESQAGARMTLASGVAILVLPLLLGRLADLAGLRAAYGVVAALFAVMLIMMLAASKLSPAGEPIPAGETLPAGKTLPAEKP